MLVNERASGEPESSAAQEWAEHERASERQL